MNKQQIVNYTREILSEAISSTTTEKADNKREPDSVPITNIIVTNRGESWIMMFLVCLIFLFFQTILPVKAVILYPIIQSEEHLTAKKQFLVRAMHQNNPYYVNQSVIQNEPRSDKQRTESMHTIRQPCERDALSIPIINTNGLNSPQSLNALITTQLKY